MLSNPKPPHPFAMPSKTKLPEIKLTAHAKALLAETREEISDALNIWQKSDSTLNRMMSDARNLADEIQALESKTDYKDTKGIASMEAKRAQLKILENQMAPLMEKGNARFEEVRQAVFPMNQVMRQTLLPWIDQMQREIARTIAEFETNWPMAMEKARTTEIMWSASHFFITCGWGQGGPMQADRAIRVIDALLRGENPWSFKCASEPESK
jgi:hypothetical protein